VKCDVCGVRKANIYQPHTGLRLCKECFMRNIVKRVKEELIKYKLIKPNEKVLLAISGGKDSFTLLDVMSKIHDTEKLVALTIIEGIHGYNRESEVCRIKKYVRERGVDHIVTSFKEYSGYTLDEYVKAADSKSLRISPCTFCGILRRRVINAYARELGMDKVATAHNLDDEVQTVLMNILRGDLIRLIQTHPKGPKLSKHFVRKVKPLRKIYEWETAVYAYFSGFEFQETECPFITTRPSLRAKLREYLYTLEKVSPGSLLNILNTIDELLGEVINDVVKHLPKELPLCIKCGEPTALNRKVCKFCELIDMIGLDTKRR